MAIKYPKQEISEISDKDYALHPTVRSDEWLTNIQKQDETELYLSQTRVTLQGLSYIFEQKCSLSLVDLIGITSDPDEFIAFLNSLIGCKTLKKLFLCDVQIGDISTAVDCLVKLIENKDNQIELLLLAGWNMGAKLTKFSSSLARSNHLRVLDLSHCGIEDIQSGMVELCSVLRNTPIQELYLDENPFGDDGAKILSVALRQNPILEVLSVKFCKITPLGIINLLESLDHSTLNQSSDDLISNSSVNSNLVFLYIADMTTELDDDKIIKDLAIQCSSTIENNQFLRELDLSGHYFNTECGLIIMRSLQNNKTLKKLNLSYSKKNWNSDQLLLEFFQSNQSVSSLHLRNHMPSLIYNDYLDSTNHLVYSIPNDEKLKEFFVWNMTDNEFELLCTGLASNSSLLLLDLLAMQLNEITLPLLVKMIQSNNTISEILIKVSDELDLNDLFKILLKDSIRSISITNLTYSQGKLLVKILESFGDNNPSKDRISISFINGAVHCDIWERVNVFLTNSSVTTQNESYLIQ